MSYVQGTIVRISGTFRSNITELLIEPPEVTVTVSYPDPDGTGVITQAYTLADAEVVNDPGVGGTYYADIDTSPAPGTWTYQFESGDPNAVVGKSTFTVRSRI